MVKPFYLVLFALIACGKEVNISNRKLEANSSLASHTNNSTNQEGMLIRGTKDMINNGGSSYQVSIYSSYSALEFIAARPLQTQHPVRYRGKLKNNEMVIEYIEARK